jgi:hypothetical protein
VEAEQPSFIGFSSESEDETSSQSQSSLHESQFQQKNEGENDIQPEFLAPSESMDCYEPPAKRQKRLSEEEIREAIATCKYGDFSIFTVQKGVQVPTEFDSEGREVTKDIPAQENRVSRPVRVVCSSDTPKCNSYSKYQ